VLGRGHLLETHAVSDGVVGVIAESFGFVGHEYRGIKFVSLVEVLTFAYYRKRLPTSQLQLLKRHVVVRFVKVVLKGVHFVRL